MTVYYKKDGKDVKIDGVSWVDTFMTEDGHNTAVIYKDKEIVIPLQDLISIVDK